MEEVILAAKSKKYDNLKKILITIVSTFGVFFLVGFLFNPKRNIFWLAELYLNTMNQYQSTSLGAMNLYGLFDIIGNSPDTTILGIKSSVISVAAIIIGTILCGAIVFFGRSKSKYLSATSVLYIFIFTFATGMHERYLLPILLTLLLLYVYNLDRSHFYMYMIFTTVSFFCIARVLSAYYNAVNMDSHFTMRLFSLIMVAGCLVFSLKSVENHYRSKDINHETKDKK